MAEFSPNYERVNFGFQLRSGSQLRLGFHGYRDSHFHYGFQMSSGSHLYFGFQIFMALEKFPTIGLSKPPPL